jgi:hypothetical protein
MTRRLVWIHAGRKRTMLVLSWHGSNVQVFKIVLILLICKSQFYWVVNVICNVHVHLKNILTKFNDSIGMCQVFLTLLHCTHVKISNSGLVTDKNSYITVQIHM